MNSLRARITAWLSASPPVVLTLYAMVFAFSTYFCMYAFRKPFSAGVYKGMTFFETGFELKAAFIISQVIGYMLSKFIGIKVCSEAEAKKRLTILFFVILSAEFALLLFAVLPLNLKFIALFLNGLPLGMTWGLVVGYLEGRRTSDAMMAALSCSFIVSSGVVKDAGLWLLNFVPEFWMPFLTGLLFLPAFMLSAWMLSCIPLPVAADEAERSHRTTMNARQRAGFLMRYLPGMTLMIFVYFLLTAFRDYRDNFGVEIMKSLDIDTKDALFTRMELLVGLGVMLTMASLNAVRKPKAGLVTMFIVMGSGLLLMGISTALLDAHVINGFWWVTLAGLGAYLAYVPHNSILFERLLAWTRYPGTVAFAIQLSDAFGYIGAVGILLYKFFFNKSSDRLAFFKSFTYGLSAIGIVSVAVACGYFLMTKRDE